MRFAHGTDSDAISIPANNVAPAQPTPLIQPHNTEAQVVAVPAASLVPQIGFVLSQWQRFEDVAIAWRELPLSDSPTRLRLARRADGTGAVISPGETQLPDAAIIASRFGATMTPLETAEDLDILIPEIRRPKEVINVRSAPNGGGARSIPWGTLVVALTGAIQGQTSNPPGEKKGRTFVVATSATSGWISSDRLASYDGCVPPLAVLTSKLSETPDSETLVANTTISRVPWFHDHGKQGLGYLLVGRDIALRHSFFAFFGDNGACATQELYWRVDERLAQNVTPEKSTDANGDTMFVVQWEPVGTDDPEGMVTWSVFAPPPSNTEWTREFRTSSATPVAERQIVRMPATTGAFAQVGYWPFGIKQPDGGGFVLRYDPQTQCFVETDVNVGVDVVKNCAQ